MQGGWQPPPGGGGYGAPPGGGGYGAPPGGAPPGGGYGAPQGYGAPPGGGFAPNPYGAPPQGMGGGMMNPQYGNYEFNEYENSVIDKTASRVKLWGIISVTLGALEVLGSCGMFAAPNLGTWLPQGIVSIVVGVTFIGAGNSLKSVVTTQGNDLQHLMQAFQKMSTAFIVEIVAAIVGFAFAVIALLLVMFVFVATAATQ